jgi:hypothetical protein
VAARATVVGCCPKDADAYATTFGVVYTATSFPGLFRTLGFATKSLRDMQKSDCARDRPDRPVCRSRPWWQTAEDRNDVASAKPRLDLSYPEGIT